MNPFYNVTILQTQSIEADLEKMKQNHLGKVLYSKIKNYSFFVSENLYHEKGLGGAIDHQQKRIYLDRDKCFSDEKFNSMGRFILRHEIAHGFQDKGGYLPALPLELELKKVIWDEVGANTIAFLSFIVTSEDASDLRDFVNSHFKTKLKSIPVEPFLSEDKFEKEFIPEKIHSIFSVFKKHELSKIDKYIKRSVAVRKADLPRLKKLKEDNKLSELKKFSEQELIQDSLNIKEIGVEKFNLEIENTNIGTNISSLETISFLKELQDEIKIFLKSQDSSVEKMIRIAELKIALNRIQELKGTSQDQSHQIRE